MAFLVFQWPKMNEKKDAALILAVEFKSEEKSRLSLLEKKISNFCLTKFCKKSKKNRKVDIGDKNLLNGLRILIFCKRLNNMKIKIKNKKFLI